jgi:hypothetical protein
MLAKVANTIYGLKYLRTKANGKVKGLGPI